MAAMTIRQHAAQWCAILAAMLASGVPLVAGLATEGYSHTSSYISELGAKNMEHGMWVSLGGFLPTGLLSLFALIAAAPVARDGRRVSVGYAVLFALPLAYIGSALARCDAGCPTTGSPSQIIHNLLGVAEYLGVGIGLLLIASGLMRDPALRGNSVVLMLSGLVVLASFIAMAMPSFAVSRGLVQRVGEGAIFVALIVFCALPQARRR